MANMITNDSMPAGAMLLVVLVSASILLGGAAGILESSTANDTTAKGDPSCLRSMHMDCDSDPSNGCETFIGEDVRNCGACAAPCHGVTGPTLFHTTVLCSNGTCSYLCDHMMGDCDYDIVSNGCETDLNGSDRNHCGECGVPCSTYDDVGEDRPHTQGGGPLFAPGSSAGQRSVQRLTLSLINFVATVIARNLVKLFEK